MDAKSGNNSLLYLKMIEEIEDYAIILLDREGFIQNWNKGAEKIKQYKKEEVIGKHFSIFYLQEDRDSGLPGKLMYEAAEAGKAVDEGWRRRKDGARFWGSITITAIHDEDNNVIGFSKVTRDLTDRKSSEDNLKMSEERYHQMIAEVQDYAIILLDEHGIIRNWNAGAEFIKGYSSTEAIGKSFEIFYPPEDRESKLPSTLLQEAKEKGKANYEGWRLRKDGSRFWGTIVITALHDRGGEIIGFSKVTRDLTQKKLDDMQLLSYMSELEIRNSELEQFAYVASHDLQEPLRKIQTFAALIQENYNNEGFARRYFHKLDLSAKRMSELVRSLLNYSRLAQDKSEVVEVDLNTILAEVKQDFELLLEEKNAAITSGTLPAIRGNRVQLGQLFSNLISNSLKFSKGSPLIRINSMLVRKSQVKDAPASLPERNYWQIDFIDNGIGFEQQYDKLIFSLFQRLHGKQDYDGTGIGLALCKKIVENHNGMIMAKGEMGVGATFSVYLPVM